MPNAKAALVNSGTEGRKIFGSAENDFDSAAVTAASQNFQHAARQG
jgi:hypothetical protein